MTLTLIQLVAVILAALALLVGIWMLVVAKKPWGRRDVDSTPPPRVRLLGLSYILVFGSAMIQVVTQPSGEGALALGGLMVMGGVIVLAVVFLGGRTARA